MTDYKLVPVEPTEEMLEAGHYAMVAGCHPGGVYADMLAAAPAVQGEPVGWQFYQDGKCWIGVDRIKGYRKNTEEAGYPTRDVYAVPQPAEQQPEPISRNLRAVHAMILNALDRDATDGKAVRGEMAAELRSALSEHQHAPDAPGLVEAMRQYRHNDGSGVVFGYDLETTQRVVAGLVEALEELINLMEDTRQGEYNPDSFTTQPARIALEAYRKGVEP